MKSIRLGLIGCGAATQRYYLPLLKKNPSLCKNLYLADTNIPQAEQVAKLLNAGRVTADYTAMIGQVDGVIIVVPPFLHYEIAKFFLEAKVTVLCEKPLAESASEVDELNDLANKNSVYLCVNNTRRMFPNFQGVKQLLAENKIGRILNVEYTEGSTFGWASSTGFYVDPRISSKGILLDVGPHVLDTICWWLDRKPDLIKYEDDSFGGPESLARIQAKVDSTSVTILLNRLNDLSNYYKLTGEEGVIDGKIFEWDTIIYTPVNGAGFRMKQKVKAKVYPEFVIPIFNNFIQILLGKEKPLVSGQDVVNSIRFIDECYQKRERMELTWNKNLERLIE
jgi:predicted dehydrogenase